ncbi:MAG: sulfite exporter TauE/SafE family protein [Candidatus Micrarchaeota archaeon]|nr:sulfite exporter TauE/SafE family protein [Candidatus Micrarchaeota archaeon]
MERNEVVFANSVMFVIGFTIVFSLVGVLIETLFTHINITLRNDLSIIGGLIIAIFGVLLILSVKYIIPVFSSERKLHARRFRNSYLSSLVFGIAFAIGWTPCVGPILGSIYVFAITSPSIGFLLLLFYSLGIAIPFLVAGALISKLSDFMRKARVFLKYFNIIGGLLLIAVGLLVVTGYIGMLSIFLFGSNFSLSATGQLNLLVALAAGIITFLSPCILPLLPAYLSYMAGTTAEVVKR